MPDHPGINTLPDDGPTMERVACKLCGADRTLELIREPITHVNWQGKGECRAVICEACGLVYLSPRLTREGYNDFYTHNFSAHANDPAVLAELIDRKYLPEKRRLLEKVLPMLDGPLPDDAEVLDIGCGYGELLGAYREKHGARLTGIELGEYAAKYATDRFGVDIVSMDINGPIRMDRNFDLIFLIAVIEHVLDPVEVFREIRENLKPDGQLVVLTPDLLDVTPLITSANLGRVIKPVHTYYFTKETLANTGIKAGLACTHISSAGKRLSTTQNDLLAIFKNTGEASSPLTPPKADEIKKRFFENIRHNECPWVRLPCKARFYLENPSVFFKVLKRRFRK